MNVVLVLMLGMWGFILSWGFHQPLWGVVITVIAALVDVKSPRVWEDRSLPASPLLSAYILGVSGAMAISYLPFLFSPVIGFGLGYASSRIIKSSKPH